MKYFFKLTASLFLILIIPNLYADLGGTLKIYLDADWTSAKSSSLAIEQGIKTALSEINNTVSGYKIEIVNLDHHGNSRRSAYNMRKFLDDTNAIAFFCGLHSPPVLSNLDFINEEGLLLLDPWAAAGPITRKTDSDGLNWVYRLSIDDTLAGEVIVASACDKEGFEKPVLLLEDTGWGKSNRETMVSALENRGIVATDIIWFNWNIRENGAREILSQIFSIGADVIIMVANASEGETFLRAMSEREKAVRLPIRSHWGITGGELFDEVGADILVNKIDLQFIQTSFSFLNKQQTSFSKGVFRQAASLFSTIEKIEDIKAPAGFIHAYDLTKILISAIRETELSDDMITNRRLLRDKLERLDTPVEGLIKTYVTPFTPYSSENSSGHEALGLEDFKMAEYTFDGGITLLEEN